MISNTLEVSIISPVYNVGTLIEETAESVLSQEGVDWEWILVDDGSGEETRKLLAELAESDSRITVEYQENQGAQVARNRGLRLARGEYVKFLDADDLLGPDLLASQVRAMRETGRRSAVSPYRYLIDKQGHRRLTEVGDNGGCDDDLLLLHLTLGTGGGSLMFERSLIEEIGGWDESLKADQDGDLVFRVALVDNRYTWVDCSHFIYRDHDRAPRVSKGYGLDKIESRLKVTDRVIKQLSETDELNPYRSGFAHRYDWIGRLACVDFPDVAEKCFTARNRVCPGYTPRMKGLAKWLRFLLGDRRAELLRRWMLSRGK